MTIDGLYAVSLPRRGFTASFTLPSSLMQMVVQFAGTGGTANELAKIRYITQVRHCSTL